MVETPQKPVFQQPEPAPASYTPAARAHAVSAYSPPRGRPVVDMPESPALKLDANEGPAPAGMVLEWLAQRGPELVRRYPSVRALEVYLADRLGIEPERVVVTAGADDALARFASAALEPGREAVLADPTFEMIPRYVRLAGGHAVTVPWRRGPLPVEGYLDAMSAHTGCAYVVTPNNPTGTNATTDDVLRVVDGAHDRGRIPVAVDLAYTEFAGDDPTDAVLERSNAVVMRTLSKAWGLAGLRVGYAAGPPELIGWLRRVGQAYAVSSVSAAIALDWLQAGEQRVFESAARVKAERAGLTALCEELGASVTPSEANFVLADWGACEAAWALADALADRGIAVRRFPEEGSLASALRITCPGDVASAERLFGALRESSVALAKGAAR